MKFILETKLKDLGIGIKDVSLQNQWLEWCLDNKKKCLDEICFKKWEETNQGIIAFEDVYLQDKQLKQIPFKFYKAERGFHIENNLLTSLVGSPENVKWHFLAHHNRLQNLVGGPKRAEYSYNVSFNQINSLEGAPKYVGAYFVIMNQRIPPGKEWLEREIREKIDVNGEVYV